MNTIEGYDRALQERRRAKSGMIFNLVLIALLIMFWAVTISIKGWDNEYWFSLIGFTMLGILALMRYREMRYWDRQINGFIQSFTPFSKRNPS